MVAFFELNSQPISLNNVEKPRFPEFVDIHVVDDKITQVVFLELKVPPLTAEIDDHPHKFFIAVGNPAENEEHPHMFNIAVGNPAEIEEHPHMFI